MRDRHAGRAWLGAVLSCLTVAIAEPCSAQLFFEDAEGQDLFLLYGPDYNQSVNFGINSKDKSARVRAFFQGSVPRQLFHAFELRARAPGDIADIFSADGVSPGVSGAYLLGKMRLFTKRPGISTTSAPAIDWAFVRVGYTVEKYDLYDAEAEFAEQFSEERFRGLAITLNYTLLLGGAHVLAVTGAYERRNNAGGLKEVKVLEQRSDTSDGIIRVATRERAAREGAYQEFDSYPLRISWTRKPGELPADADKLKWGPSIYLAVRSTPAKDPATIGLAAFLTRANTNGVRTTLGGLYLEARDAFDATDSGRSLQDRFVGGVFVSLPVFLQR
jgi:hypothetical protein